MKILIINKSDSTGGAAVVSHRMMQALREAGHDARMLVAERLTDSPYVALAASPARLKAAFLSERLGIAFANGFNRSTLFQIDTASAGVPVWRHPWFKEADVVLLNWVNQGLLSLKGIKKICNSGKKVAWVMHDMWCATGICHHAHSCPNYRSLCHSCPLLHGSDASSVAKKQSTMETTLPRVVTSDREALVPCERESANTDLSTRTQARKRALYRSTDILFIPVSHWLEEVAKASTLLKDQRLEVIPNPFPIEPYKPRKERGEQDKIRILFGAARLDDPIKGLPILIEATKWLRDNHPEFAARCELVTFGNAKDPASLEGIAIPTRHLGRVAPADIRALYEQSDIVVSTSHFETLPGTLVEGQAYGAVPVAFLRGGQADIIDHLHTGFLARWSDHPAEAAASIGEGILWAASQGEPTRRAMHASASRFSYPAIAELLKLKVES